MKKKTLEVQQRSIFKRVVSVIYIFIGSLFVCTTNVFAEGSLKAAEFIAKQKPGLYCMEDMSY